MPLADQFGRQVDTLATVSTFDAVNDFVAVHDASAGNVCKLALKDLRGVEFISVPMHQSTTASLGATTAQTPRRIIRAPYSFKVVRLVATCVTTGASSSFFDVWKNGVSLNTGGNTLTTTGVLELAASSRQGSVVPAFSLDITALDELRFHIPASATAVRQAWVHIVGFRV